MDLALGRCDTGARPEREGGGYVGLARGLGSYSEFYNEERPQAAPNKRTLAQVRWGYVPET